MADISFNRSRFLQVCRDICAEGHPRFNIGTYKEKKLHLILKNYFEPLTSCQEIPYCGYVADIRNGEGITEIQTSGFASMNGKLEAFLPDSAVTLVFPIAEKKWVTWIEPESGEIQPRHRSPKKGALTDVLPEMVFVREHLGNPHLTVRCVLLEIEEYRMLDGYGKDKKARASRYEKIPTALCGTVTLSSPEDFRMFLPDDLPDRFTAAQYAKASGQRGRNAYYALHMLVGAGLLAEGEKLGRAQSWVRTNTKVP